MQRPKEAGVAPPIEDEEDLNDPELDDEPEDTSPPTGVDLSGPQQGDGLKPLDNEDDEMLVGPTTRPRVPVNSGITSRRVPVPRELHRYLPALQAAAGEPDAPDELVLFMRLLAQQMGES